MAAKLAEEFTDDVHMDTTLRYYTPKVEIQLRVLASSVISPTITVREGATLEMVEELSRVAYAGLQRLEFDLPVYRRAGSGTPL